MNAAEVMAELESLGTEQARKIYRKHGLQDPMFGVSYANLGKLKKRIKCDQPLAEALWATGNHDAQALAVFIADPAAFDTTLLESWARSTANHGIADAFAKDIVIRSPNAMTLALTWIDSEQPKIQRLGWATAGCLAIYAAECPEADFLDFLPRLEADIHAAPNRVKESMNSALIAIGSRDDALRGPATEAARRIGKVPIDHGETNCKTPDAVSYIDKTFARRLSRTAS